MAEINGIRRGNRIKDLTGLVVGRLTVVRFAGRDQKSKWVCRCECGNECTVAVDKLQDAVRPTRSCGCLAREVSAENGSKRFTHKMSHSPEYYSWQGMKRRCEDPRTTNFALYGGRGIVVCERWRTSFESFFEDMGPRPSRRHSLDRINNHGNYEPENCRWATKKTQSRNTRTNRTLLYNGDQLSVAALCELSGISRSTMTNRLKRGWTVEEAVNTPVDASKRTFRNGRVRISS